MKFLSIGKPEYYGSDIVKFSFEFCGHEFEFRSQYLGKYSGFTGFSIF